MSGFSVEAMGVPETYPLADRAGMPITSLPAEKLRPVARADELPLLCHEACNLLVARTREVVKAGGRGDDDSRRQVVTMNVRDRKCAVASKQPHRCRRLLGGVASGRGGTRARLGRTNSSPGLINAHCHLDYT